MYILAIGMNCNILRYSETANGTFLYLNLAKHYFHWLMKIFAPLRKEDLFLERKQSVCIL